MLNPILWGELMTVAEKLEQRGMEKGLAQGREQGVRQIALNLLREGVDIQFVIKVTGLSEVQVRALDPNSIKPS